MSFMRARAFRSLQQGLRSSSARPVARVLGAQVGARRWASGGGGHGEHEASSDLPWLLSAGVITPVACYFLWPSSHGDAGHHGGHGEEHEEHEEAEEQGEEKSEDASEEKSEEAPAPAPAAEDGEHEQKKESPETIKPTGTEGDSQPKASDANKKSSGTEEPSEPVQKGGKPQTEGIKAKGHMKEDAAGWSQTSKREPDGKGGYKNRVDSGYQTDLGTSTQYAEDGREPAAAAKPKGTSQGDISNKQAGMSNTPTRHSTAIHEDPEKSKKGEGMPETAKVMGTVDPKRPQAESPDRGEKQ